MHSTGPRKLPPTQRPKTGIRTLWAKRTGRLAARCARLNLDTQRVIRLAAPVAVAELGWMGMGVVDTIMVGGLGPAAITQKTM